MFLCQAAKVFSQTDDPTAATTSGTTVESFCTADRMKQSFCNNADNCQADSVVVGFFFFNFVLFID